MAPLYIKALHIIGVVVWFSALFYLGRLFVYHREAHDLPEATRDAFLKQYELMERRLALGIGVPGMLVTLIAGIALIGYVGMPIWLHWKLAFVALLIMYHMYCGAIRRQLREGNCNWTSRQLRLFNEVPAVFLIIIVFSAILKNAVFQLHHLWIVLGVIAAIGAIIYFRRPATSHPLPASENDSPATASE